MSKLLNDKLREVEAEHFAEAETALLTAADQQFFAEAHRFAGAVAAVTSIARSLTAKTIEGLMQVEEKKYYSVWLNPKTGRNFQTFAEYLNSDEVPDFSKNKYYELKALYLSEGPEAFDVFSGQRIAVSTRKLLAAKGVEITVDGDDLVIADKRVPVTDRAAVKELVQTMHEVLRDRDTREAKKDAKIETLTNQVDQGVRELSQLQRELDAMSERDPYERALGGFVVDGLKLCERIGELDPKVRAERAGHGMRVIWDVVKQLRLSYDINFNFEDTGDPTQITSETTDLVRKVLAEDDDFGDDLEG